jgi:hypothetical protein
MNDITLVDVNIDNILEYGVCGYKNIKREGFPEKINWLKERFNEGLKIKALYSGKDGTQGMIEYIPGKYCWRPVEATGYMFIHCIFSGFKNSYKNKGYGSLLLKECLNDAKNKNLAGVAVVTRKVSFMADKDIFLKNAFTVVDSASPDFNLLVKKFNKNTPFPHFKGNGQQRLQRYKNGLTIIRADQCPYTVKNVKEIVGSADTLFGIKPEIINLKNYQEAQESPCSFGSFCIIYNGEIIAHHPISNTRFINIMNKIR